MITVDGIKYTYKKVWLAPTINGRFYGGGMMPAPGQDRENNENIYMVGADFKEGEYISVAKYDVAAMFVDDSELYEPWKNAYLEYLKNKSDARQLFRERAGGLFGKKN